MEELTESQIARECKPYEFNEQRRSCFYAITDHPIAGRFGNEWDHSLQHKNFSEAMQMLWFFRKHPEYHHYLNAETQRLLDLLGLDEAQKPDPRENFDSERGISCNWRGRSPNQTFDRKEMTIYIPSLDAFIKPGILTDLVYAFGRKSLKLPQGAYEGHNLSIADRNNNINALFVGCAPLPYATEEDVWLGFFAPRLCAEEYMQKRAKKRLGYNDPQYFEYVMKHDGLEKIQKAIDQSVAHQHRRINDLNILPLEDIANSSLAFVKEFAPERYDRFSKAISCI